MGDRGVGLIPWDLVLGGSRTSLDIQFPQFVDDLAENTFHADARVFRVLHS